MSFGQNQTAELNPQKKGRKHEHLTLDSVFKPLDNYNYRFFVTNFEPFKVITKLQQMYILSQVNPFLKNQNDILINKEDALQQLKIQDLKDFGGAIMEILVGRFMKDEIQKRRNSDKKVNTSQVFHNQRQTSITQPTFGANSFIPIDYIPLNWKKLPLMQNVLEIIRLCFHRYNSQQTINVDTSRIFELIQEQAILAYNQMFNIQDNLSGFIPNFKIEKSIFEQQDELARKQSLLLNNKAIGLYLTLNDLNNQIQIQETILKIESIFKEAIQLCPKNQVILLNHFLYQWELGKIRDDEFQFENQKQIAKIDPMLARLVYFLFRKNVEGEQVPLEMCKKLISEPLEQNQFPLSNLSRKLLQGPEFVEFWPQQLTYQKKAKKIQQQFINKVYLDEQQNLVKNQRFCLEKNFKAIDIFFSNNDIYVGVISVDSILIIDTRINKIVWEIYIPDQYLNQETNKEMADYETKKQKKKKEQESILRRLPTKQKLIQQEQHEEIDLDNLKDLLALAIKKRMIIKMAGKQVDNKQDEKSNQKRKSKSNELTHEQKLKKKYRLSKQNNQSQLNTISKSKEPTPNISSIRQRINEMTKLPKWKGVISNNGKQVAIFDESQQVQNQNDKQKEQKTENLIVFSMKYQRKKALQPDIFNLDMISLLNGQEVLSFELDDRCINLYLNNRTVDSSYISSTVGMILVQAKDLMIYNINYQQHELIQKFDIQSHSLRSSIFYSPLSKQSNSQYIESLKQFSQQQKALGNKLYFPKINDEIVAVKQKDQTILKLYHIKLKKFVRQLKISRQTSPFDGIEEQMQENELDIEEQIDFSQESSVENLLDDNNQKTHFQILQQKIEKAKKKQERIIQFKELLKLKNQKLSESVLITKEDQQTKIENLNISPFATMIVSVIGHEVVIRMLNQVNKCQYKGGYYYQKSIVFLPLHFDEDFYFKYSPPQIQVEQSQMEKSSISSIESRDDLSKSKDLLIFTQKDLNQQNRNFEQIQQFKSSIFRKSSHLCELTDFVNKISKDPKTLLQQLPNKYRLKNLEMILCMLRTIHDIDRSHVLSTQIQGVHPLFKFDNFNFARSSEIVKDFDCSQHPSKNLIACFINRTIQVYDYVQYKLLFSNKLPMNLHQDQIIGDNRHHIASKNIRFIDDDKIIMARTRPMEITFYSVKPQQKIFHKTTLKMKKDEDTVVLVDIPKPGLEIDVGFRALDVKPQKGQDLDGGSPLSQNNSKHENDEKIEDDNQDDQEKASKTIETDFEIKGIYCSRNSKEFTSLAIIGEFEFKLYSVYEQVGQGCEIDYRWGLDYRYFQKLKNCGKCTSFDFEESGITVSMGTCFGWVCTFNFESRNLIDRFRIMNPEDSNQWESVDILRDISLPYKCITYNSRSQHLLFCSRKNMQKNVDIRNIGMTVKLFPFNSQIHGGVIQIQTDIKQRFLIAELKSRHISIFDIKSQEALMNVEANPIFLRNNIPCPIPTFIDDQCTYMATLNHQCQSVDMRCISWKYEYHQLTKAEKQMSIYSKSFASTIQESNQRKESNLLTIVQSPQNNTVNQIEEKSPEDFPSPNPQQEQQLPLPQINENQNEVNDDQVSNQVKFELNEQSIIQHDDIKDIDELPLQKDSINCFQKSKTCQIF